MELVRGLINAAVKVVVKAVFNNVAIVLAYVKIIKDLIRKIIFNLFRKKYLTNSILCSIIYLGGTHE